MTRTVTGAAASALDADHLRGLIFVELDFASGFVRANNSAHDVTWNGYAWLGLGLIGAIDPIVDGGGLQSRGLAFQLSGVDTANVALALGEQYQGRGCNIWFAPLDADNQPVADPVGPWTYRMDTMGVTLGEQATITVTAETRMADWNRRRARRYNDADQQALYSGDKGMQYVEQLVDKLLMWGPVPLPKGPPPVERAPDPVFVSSDRNGPGTVAGSIYDYTNTLVQRR